MGSLLFPTIGYVKGSNPPAVSVPASSLSRGRTRRARGQTTQPASSGGSRATPFTIASGTLGEVSAQQLSDTIRGTSTNSNGVEQLGMTVSDPPTQAIAYKDRSQEFSVGRARRECRNTTPPKRNRRRNAPPSSKCNLEGAVSPRRVRRQPTTQALLHK
jgi:hypothetical protein